MITYLLIAIAVLILGFVLVVATRPADFRIVRTALLPAPPAAIFEQVNDLHNWKAWSPWEKLDPHSRQTYEGPASGVGAIFRWEGNNQVGAGNMTILESRPDEWVRIELVFLKPFQATNLSEFIFQPQDSQTLVTWSMTGKNNFMARAMGLFMNFDKMIGGQFEEGLANLKALFMGVTVR